MEEITIRDVAQICGVGVSTVSRAINNHPDISPETRQMVMQVIKEHNYIPNNSARNLKRQTAKAIAVLVKGIDNSFFHEMIRDIEEEIKKKKYTMVLRHVKSSEDEVNVALQLVKEKRLKGIIFLGGCFVHNEEKLSQLQVPFVLSTAGAVALDEKKVKYCSVSVDDEKESYWMLPGYMKMLEAENAIPMMLPLTANEKELDYFLEICGGFLLTGGHDVSPSVYQVHFPSESHAQFLTL